MSQSNPQTALQRFSTVMPMDSLGASSNTAQKGQLTLGKPIIDWLTVSFPFCGERPAHALETADSVAAFILNTFGIKGKLEFTDFEKRSFNWCPYSALIIDEHKNLCGKVGLRDDGSFLVSITGLGCQHVENWEKVHKVIAQYKANISRVDIAVDDFSGEHFNVQYFKQAWHEDKFTLNGRPPLARFIDDMGTGKGCTLYIGQKGHKELCIYEKGIQLGNPESKHVRCELRLFANKIEIKSDVLINPEHYYSAAYPLLAEFVVGEISKLEIKQRLVDSSIVGMIRFLKTQCGKSINLAMEALGDDAMQFLIHEVCRDGRPGRFKNVSGDLVEHFRSSIKKE